MSSHCLSFHTALLPAFGKHQLLNYTCFAIASFLFYTVLWDTTLTKEQFIKQEKSHLSHAPVGAGVAIWQVAAHSPPRPARAIAQILLPALAEWTGIQKAVREEKYRELSKMDAFQVKGDMIYHLFAITAARFR